LDGSNVTLLSDLSALGISYWSNYGGSALLDGVFYFPARSDPSGPILLIGYRFSGGPAGIVSESMLEKSWRTSRSTYFPVAASGPAALLLLVSTAGQPLTLGTIQVGVKDKITFKQKSIFPQISFVYQVIPAMEANRIWLSAQLADRTFLWCTIELPSGSLVYLSPAMFTGVLDASNSALVGFQENNTRLILVSYNIGLGLQRLAENNKWEAKVGRGRVLVGFDSPSRTLYIWAGGRNGRASSSVSAFGVDSGALQAQLPWPHMPSVPQLV